MISTLVLFCMSFIGAYGLCDFPCSWQNRVWYNAKSDVDISVHTSTYDLIIDGSVAFTVECFQRNGPFIIISRFGYQYSCLKVIFSGKDVFIDTGMPPVNSTTSPDFCSICSRTVSEFGGNDFMEVWVDLGCNIPKNCPSGSYDTPCTGCEEDVPDDGYCCESKGDSYGNTA